MTDFKFKRTWGPQPRYPLVEKYEPPSDRFKVIAGPCSVENTLMIDWLADHVLYQGATHLRGGVFRAGTYPGPSFGLIAEHLLEYFALAAQLRCMENIIEILDYSEPAFTLAQKYATCLQIGCRQMQNYTLLRKVAETGKPVFLKRHPGATLDEFLGAAEHLLAAGANDVTLIERGSSTHANHVRWDLSISMIPAVKAITRMPIIVDASHGTGRRDLVEPMTLAGVAAGADGILVEVHLNPEKSLSDADQAIDVASFSKLMNKVKAVRSAIKEAP